MIIAIPMLISITIAVVTVALGLKNEILHIVRLLRILISVKLHGHFKGNKTYSFVDEVEAKVDKNPSHVQFIVAETGVQYTLKEFDEICNQVAWWGKNKGLKQSDTIALMMLNHPHYVSIWLGLSKIGVRSALLNTNNTGKPFLHGAETALASSDVKIVIVDIEMKNKLTEEIADLVSKGFQVYYWGETGGSDTITKEVLALSKERPSRNLRALVIERDPLIYIFTSGTTGLPKACKISQTRYFMASLIYPYLCALNETDVIYTPLPLYHSAAGMLGTGGALYSTTTMVLRKKFSASNFTADCLKYKVTTVQYIGELCRYLVNAPPNERDNELKLRTAFGNGMRVEYWEKFRQRYHVDRVVEFYAATEGNVGLFNSTGKVGALGYIPPAFDFIYPVRVIRTDPEDQSKPLRNAKGRCEVCRPGEVGLLVSHIQSSGDPTRRFDGYTDSKSTSSKVLVDVFKQGDQYFNTGDLIVRDQAGYFLWSDRIGDTFRWKGENVSTTEVSQVVSEARSIQDVVVYGVEIPNTDGRGGMAAIIAVDEVNHEIDLEDLSKLCGKHLPPYARPIFLRVKVDNKLPMTTTHKYIKADLVKQVSDLSWQRFLITAKKDLINIL